MTSSPLYPDAVADPRRRDYLPPRRILYATAGDLAPDNPERLLTAGERQAQAEFQGPLCRLLPGAAILLDFGRELNGGVRLVTPASAGQVRTVRVRFGESAGEAMGTPNNDHAIHDTRLDLPPMGATEIGNTGFRFVRLDVPADAPAPLELAGVWAVALYRDLPYAGSFRCSDERLNQVWQTGAYTVHLNMQDYIYDGIKRDRLVWLGDLHPEVRVITTVFDDTALVPASLDFVRDRTPLPQFMNGISSYSVWWVIIQHDWYWHRGDLDYLKAQRDYLLRLLRQLAGYVGADGAETLPGGGFFDWPSNDNPVAIHAGMQALLAWGFAAGERLCRWLGEEAAAQACAAAHGRLSAHRPEAGNSKQANAFLALAGLADPGRVNREVLARDPFSGLSTFLGYYVLQARALAGDQAGALEVIRRYWGGMLDRGATTFWEDFDLAWLPGAGRIDALPLPGQKDLHADFGRYCYQGLRHSLCHGWAGGPTAWLSEQLLGAVPLAPGFAAARVQPQLFGLDWVQGTVPTPHGPLVVTAERRGDGSVARDVKVPSGVRLAEA
ncbi:MAG: alpha-L-rhamnosidase C-terminal domain-containing protein [Lentisphaeria bacterium]